MSFTALKNVNSFLVAADLHEKAFDSVKWKFLRQTRESFKAGISTFHSDISSCVMNNGFTSRSLFQQTFSRVHRGDPLFPYLSIRVLEVLAINIINDRTVKGINVEENSRGTQTGQALLSRAHLRIENREKLLALACFWTHSNIFLKY